MPESPEIDLTTLQEKAKSAISDFTKDEGEMRFAVEPVAFGLKALNITFVMDEASGSPDDLEVTLSGMEGVQSAQVTDVRRALG